MSEEKRYYSMNEIFDFLGLNYEMEKSNRQYPFSGGYEKTKFQWFNVIIPRGKIEKAIYNKLADKDQDVKKEIKMIIQCAFIRDDNCIGIIHKNVSLEWKYDKQYKYGDITTTFEEACFFIHDRARKTNDFYIINSEEVSSFISYYVINNQCGLGSLVVSSAPMIELENTSKENGEG